MVIALLLALVVATPAFAEEPDSSAAQEQEREDAALDEGETGLVLDDAPADVGSWGRARFAGDAWALRGGVPVRALALDVLLAREPGERRAFDDAHARLAFRNARWTIALGRVQPEIGAGLALGAPRAGTRTPSAFRSPAALGALSSTPARAASGFTGLWVERALGPLRLHALLARTRRDARRVGDALLPLAGVRHRDARGDSARGALAEDAGALAVTAGPAWLVLAHARADPHRVPPPGASAAEQRAAKVVRTSTAIEMGLRTSTGDVALAFDAHRRACVAFAFAPARGAALTFESEARGYVPLRARPERRAHAHAGVLLRRPAWRFEAHAIERRAFEPARLWAALRVARRGAWAELRRDADPVRTLAAFEVPLAHGVAVAGEWRFDRAGLSRETWRARLRAGLPLGFDGRIELRLAGARASVSWLDAEVPGGAWAGAGKGTERARLEVGRRGPLAPRLSWVRTRTAAGTRSEGRLAVTWSPGR